MSLNQKICSWLKLFLGTILIVFLFVGAVIISDRPPAFDIHKKVLEDMIDPTAFFYTDSDEFATADHYMSNRFMNHK